MFKAGAGMLILGCLRGRAS